MTPKTHPTLWRAFQIIADDNGMDPDEIENAADEIEPSFTPAQIAAAEIALKTLTPTELETLAAGEFDDARRVSTRSPELNVADRILGEFFDVL